MNEENKTFAEQVVEPTESERIRERITNYKAQISPQSVQNRTITFRTTSQSRFSQD